MTATNKLKFDSQYLVLSNSRPEMGGCSLYWLSYIPNLHLLLLKFFLATIKVA